ncbi:MAG TPA: hypothetical protein VMV77_01300 [Bacteroidales bacterium]|nr:hypothetical protein [Bacteroidales bacterium]
MKEPKFTLTPEIKITADEMADGISNSPVSDIMELIRLIDSYCAEWDFTVAFFLLAAEMIESEDVLRDILYLTERGDTRIEESIEKVMTAIEKVRSNLFLIKNGRNNG